MAPVVAAPVAARVVPPSVTPVIPARFDALGTAGIAGDVAHLSAEPAAAIVDPVSPAIAAVLDLLGAAVPAVLDPVGAAIPTVFDLAGAGLGAAVDPDSGAIAAPPVKLAGTDIAALFDPVGPLFAAAVDAIGPPFAATIDLTGAHFAAAVDPVGAHVAASTGIIGALGGLGAGHDVAAESARGGTRPGIDTGGRRRTLGGSAFGTLGRRGAWGSGAFRPRRGCPLDLDPRRAAAVFGPHLLAFGPSLRPGFAAAILEILRCGRRGGKGDGERGSQSCERSAPRKEGHHRKCLQ